MVDSRELAGFGRCLEHLGLNRGMVIYFGNEDYELDRKIEVKSIRSLLTNLRDQ